MFKVAPSVRFKVPGSKYNDPSLNIEPVKPLNLEPIRRAQGRHSTLNIVTTRSS